MTISEIKSEMRSLEDGDLEGWAELNRRLYEHMRETSGSGSVTDYTDPESVSRLKRECERRHRKHDLLNQIRRKHWDAGRVSK